MAFKSYSARYVIKTASDVRQMRPALGPSMAALWRLGLMQAWLRYITVRDGPENVPDLVPRLKGKDTFSM